MLTRLALLLMAAAPLFSAAPLTVFVRTVNGVEFEGTTLTVSIKVNNRDYKLTQIASLHNGGIHGVSLEDAFVERSSELDGRRVGERKLHRYDGGHPLPQSTLDLCKASDAVPSVRPSGRPHVAIGLRFYWTVGTGRHRLRCGVRHSGHVP